MPYDQSWEPDLLIDYRSGVGILSIESLASTQFGTSVAASLIRTRVMQ